VDHFPAGNDGTYLKDSASMSKLKQALEKAKKDRGELERVEVRSIEPVDYRTEHAPQAQDKPLKPVYSSTKVIQCDADLLNRNRVVSVCTRDEADRLKILRTQILNTMSEEGKNTLMITSANPGEGKTLTAINLAISFSHQFNKTVLLVDGDIRKPTIHKFMGLEDGAGLADCLVDKKSITDGLVNPGMDRIVILRGGKPHTNSAELLGSEKMKALLKEMKERYPERFIIFDTSSVLTSADPLVLANLVDGILLVVEAEKTKKEDVQKVLEMFKNKPVIGTVFNKSLD
jgi:non-specific protein-tyrosine kinase